MNKQEALEQIEQQKEAILQMQSWAFYGYIEGLVKQLDEPQTIKLPKMEFEKSRKVTVPQFVADFIAEQKNLGHTLSYSIDACMSDRVAEWYWDNSELFVQAWIFGCEVMKEKRYTVKMTATKQPLFYNNLDKRLFFSLGELATQFTRKQLEDAGFGEVFNSPLFEVEEAKE